jgi:hydrogenase large subunit
MTRLAIDPISRVGGHLRIEVEVDAGEVRDAWSSGTVFRGMELILKGRDPRDAWLFSQRVCGTCTGAHGLASVRAVEQALGVKIPSNARLLRNLLYGAILARDHVFSFYVQHALDWVDPLKALQADPAAASRLAQSISDWPNSGVSHFKEIQDRLAADAGSGRLSPFANGYWGHPGYAMPPEADLMVMAHYFDALDWQRLANRYVTILGGKDPHPQTLVVGGMALAPPWGGPLKPLTGEHPQLPERESPVPLSDEGLSQLEALITEMRAFVDRVYVPDALAIAEFHRDWQGLGAGNGNYLSAGEFPEGDTAESLRLLPPGRILGGDLARLEPVSQAEMAETVAHAWYADDGGDEALLHPSTEQTRPQYTGPAVPFQTLEGSDDYSWIKAPRYQEAPMEVGPLARILVAYVAGNRLVRAAVDDYTGRLRLDVDALTGTLGRTVARAIEAQLVVDRLDRWLTELRDNLAAGDLAIADITAWEPGNCPGEAHGWSLGEAPRGTVGHWLTVRDQLVDAYQIIDATTWNASPRDARGWRGPLEEALIGTPVVDPARPLEVLRTVHSFAPCTACAAHLAGPDVAPPIQVHVFTGAGR